MAATPAGTPTRGASAPAYPSFNSELSSFPSFPPNLDVKYTDVVARIYPVRAQIDILSQFCELYLNHFKEHPEGGGNVIPVRFRPAAPFVLMEVVNYGRMASNIANAGWFSQHELAFGLPLEMQEFRNGQWSFVKWAMCYPFIYVDSALSMSGGRQVYGWTKEFFHVDAQAPIFQPTGPKLLLHASIEVPSDKAGETQIRTFLMVSQDQLAYSARSIIPDVLTAIPRAITSSLQAAYGLLGAPGVPQPSEGNSSSGSIFSMLQRFYGNAYSFLGLGGVANGSATSTNARYALPPVSLITFKQFRDAVTPKKACFQGIVETQMRVDSIKDARLMSDLSAPDSSAGVTIALLHDDAQPVVKMLGIQTETNGAPNPKGMVLIKPLMPFWVQMDISMGCALRQVWRTPWTDWTENMDAPSLKAPAPIDYVELGSGARDELCAPFEIKTVPLRMRVLPLKADWEQLKTLVQGVFTDKLEIAPMDKIDGDGVVCLILSGFSGLTADHPKDRSYNDFELTFAVPIKWRPFDVVDAPYTYGLFPAYTFVGEAWNAATSFEVYGRLAMQSSFSGPTGLWNDEYLPPDPENTGFNLTVRTALFSHSDRVPTAIDHDVVYLELQKTRPPTTPPTAEYLKHLGFIWKDRGLEVSSIALKQIRDAVDPSRADLQTIVQLHRAFTPHPGYLPNHVVDWLPQLKVTLHEYTTLPFASKLGLTKYAKDPVVTGDGEGIYPLVSATPLYFVGSMLALEAVQIPQSVGSNKFPASLMPPRPPRDATLGGGLR
jgi:hypothetical protein